MRFLANKNRKKMTVTIRPAGQLKSFFNDQPSITTGAGQTNREFLVASNIVPEMVAGVMVNGLLQTKDYTL
jgi:hypothetical protein